MLGGSWTARRLLALIAFAVTLVTFAGVMPLVLPGGLVLPEAFSPHSTVAGNETQHLTVTAAAPIDTKKNQVNSSGGGAKVDEGEGDYRFQIHRHQSLDHPSCVAEEILRTKQPQLKEVSTTVSGPDFRWPVEKHYNKKSWNCYKHGGHNPGYPRTRGEYLTLNNVIYHRGVFYAAPGDSPDRDLLKKAKKGKKRRVPVLFFSGYFSMVSGNWPQLVTSEFHVEPELPPELNSCYENYRKENSRNERQNQCGMRALETVYFQPPTDFLSHYHVVVEIIAVTFHRLLAEGLVGFNGEKKKSGAGSGGPPVHVITSRPVHTRYGFKPKACALVHERCLDTHWGRMFTAMLNSSKRKEEEEVPLVVGLQKDHPQLAYVADSKSRMTGGDGQQHSGEQQKDQKASGGRDPWLPDEPIFIRKLFVGNPTHCEPLWGPDSFFVEAAGKAVKETAAFKDCQRMLFNFRTFYLRWAFRHSSPATGRVPSASAGGSTAVGTQKHDGDEVFNKPVVIGQSEGQDEIEILFTSREGDWARWLVNEKDVIANLRRHLKEKYPDMLSSGPRPHPRSSGAAPTLNQWEADDERNDVNPPSLDGVRVVRLGNGTLEEQLRSVTRHTTIFIANHGANIIPSVYLRPNAAVMTLSLSHPGFYPFSVFPSWLHWRDTVIEQECNRRLFKKRCKWDSPNNNDMKVSEEQMKRLLFFVDELIALQRDPSKALQFPESP